MLLDPDTGLQLRDTRGFGGPSALEASRMLLPLEINGRQALLTPGQGDGALTGVWLQDNGRFGDSFTVSGASAASGPVQALTALQMSGQTYLVAAERGGEALRVWSLNAALRLEEVAQTFDARAVPASEIHVLRSVQQQGESYVLALSSAGDSLTQLRLGAGGTLQHVARIDTREGLFLDVPTALEVVSLEGRDYALIGASGSGSLAVVELLAGGGLRPTDLVMDDLNSRFGGVTALTTLALDGQIFVLAAGADDGISLMTLLPGGRLLHLLSLEDRSDLALQDPSALAMRGTATGLEIFVTGEAEAHLSPTGEALNVLSVRLDGPAGVVRQLSDRGETVAGTDGRDQLIGGAGADRISAGDGADVLQDGAGSDRLRGGDGADVFVLGQDGAVDYILDYERGVDRLDLSSMGRFYTVEALEISSTAQGAEIVLGAERVVVNSADGRPLRASDFDIADLRDLQHVTPAPLAPSDSLLQGTRGTDLLEGRDGNDTLIGAGDSDVLRGLGGDDLLQGEGPNTAFDPYLAQVFRLYQATLDRAPDLQGLFNWTAALQAGQGVQGIAAGFVNSREFQQTYGELNNEAFVTLLYQNVLERAPDAGGLAYWTGLLETRARDRTEVVVGFSESPEFQRDTQVASASYSWVGLQSGFSDDVYRLYQATLDRAPDVAGFEDWTGRLASGGAFQQVVRGFVQSAEFQQVYGALDDEAFVTLLYNNVLDRAPDAGGRAHWLAALEDGSRAEVVEAFVQSLEFRRDTAEALTLWMRAAGVDDLLEGGSGRNILQGGLGADCFVFQADAGGQHTLVDLEPWDELMFRGFGYETAGQALSRMQQQGADVVFQDQGVDITMHNVNLSEIGLDMLLIS